MRRVVALDGQVDVESIDDLVAPPKGYLVEGIRSLISSGTELATIKDSAGQVVPRPLGYSLVGRVKECGSDAPVVEPGEIVACSGFQWSWHSELAAVPFRMATIVPSGVEASQATFTTLGATALHALRQGSVTIGDRAVVVGLGLVGQLLARVLVAAGAHVLGLDYLETRRELARAGGAQCVADSAKDDPLEIIQAWSSGVGADVIFLCTAGGPGLMEVACKSARDRGRIVVVGTPPIEVPRDPFFLKELTLTVVRAYGPGRYDPVYEVEGIDYPIGYVRWTQERNRAEFLRLLNDRSIEVSSLITHEFGMDAAKDAYELLRTDPASAMGVLFRYG